MQNNEKWKLADELQAIIDEAWKNPEFQEASKTKKNISLLKGDVF